MSRPVQAQGGESLKPLLLAGVELKTELALLVFPMRRNGMVRPRGSAGDFAGVLCRDSARGIK